MNKKLKLLNLMLMMALSPQARASIVRDDIDYQIYRDFAENKGLFYTGAMNISIYDKKGNLVGILDKAPMPDFSSVDTYGVATLINPQYIVSVNHNVGYTNVIFGGTGNNPDYHRYKYTIVDRNSHSTLDFHSPRLDKIVTEVVPAEASYAKTDDYFTNQQQFPVFYRTGSGTQYLRYSDGTFKQMGDPYHYLTGGTVSSPTYQTPDWTLSYFSDPLASGSGSLWNLPQPGDSGSPLFAWDVTQSKWFIMGVLTTVNSFVKDDLLHATSASWVMLPLDGFIETTIDSDTDPVISFNSSKNDVHWTFDGTDGRGELSSGNIRYVMHGIKDGDLNAGKNLIFVGSNGTIILDNSVDQGAGTLTFNTDYIVRPASDETWKGGGIIVNGDNTVTWQVNGVDGDSLHKIGAGILEVNATGENPGELSVGDGTVILNQRADSSGKKQAFSIIDIVSGRPTVVLNDASQVDTDNIYFGFRGGRLDLNGNDLSFKHINAVDSGAQLVNHYNDRPATVTITDRYDKKDLLLLPYVDTLQSIETYTTYQVLSDEEKRFAVLVPLNEDQQPAFDKKLAELNRTVFPGFMGEDDLAKINGELNVRYTSATADSVLALAGGANLNGTLSVENGTVLLSGYPVLHADNKIFDDDWHTSYFTVKDIHVRKDMQFQVGEYAQLNGNIHADENTRTVLGYVDDGTLDHPFWRCMLDDNTGESHCNTPSRDEAQFNVLSSSVVNGDITLADNASLSLGKVIYTGHLDGSMSSVLTMGRGSQWMMTEDSQAGTLNLGQGAQITLSLFPHTLTVNNLSGDGGTINLNAVLADASSPSNSIIINGGAATGHTHLQVHNRGGLGGQTTGDGIQLVEAINGGTTVRDAFDMPADLVAGAWRYNLYRKSGNGGWYLTTDKLSLATTSLTPARVTAPMTSLTPARVTAPMTLLTPARVTAPMASLTPARVTALTPSTVMPVAQVNDLRQGHDMTNDSHVTVSTDQVINWSGTLNGQGMLTKDGGGELSIENSQVAQTGGVMLNDGNLTVKNSQVTADVVAKEGTRLSLADHSVLTGSVDPTDMLVDNSSGWNITGDSLLNAFSDDGVVTFVPPAPGAPFVPHTLTINSLSGKDGTINLNTRLEGTDAPTDRLVIDGGTATGHTHLVVHNQGGLGAETTGNGIQLVSAINGGTTDIDAFSMSDKLTAGSWRYSLWRNPNDAGWYLTSSAVDNGGHEWVRSGHPDYSDAAWIFAGLTTQAMSYERLIASTADSRTDEGMWSRIEGGRLHQGQEAGQIPSGNAGSEANYAVIQVGGDIGSVETLTSRWRVGLYGATAQTRGESGRDNGEQAGNVSDQIFSTGAYVRGQYHHGLYVDGQVQVSRHRLNIALNDSQGRLTTRGTGLNLTAAAGWVLHADDIDITPQAQYMVQSLLMDSEVDTAGTRYDADTGGRQQLQAGVKVAHLLATTDKEDKAVVGIWMMPSLLSSFGQRGYTRVGVDGRDETSVTFGPGSKGAAASVDVGIENHISQQGKVNPNVLIGIRGHYQRGLSGSEPDSVGGQVTFKMMF